jgi:AraC-like DNA-binding protein
MPGAAVKRFGDADRFVHALRAAHLKVLPTGRGDFRAELMQIDLDKLWLQSGIESLPRTAHITIPPERAPIFFLSGADDAPIQHSGDDFRPQSMLFWGRDASHYHRTPANSRWATMSLTPADLAAATSALIGRPLAPDDVSQVLTPGVAQLARLRDLHTQARRLARQDPQLLSSAEPARALESARVHAMVSCLGEGIIQPVGVGPRQRLRTMARFEDFLAANPNRSLYLTEICRAVGASESTLRRCCSEQLGMGPNRFLLLRRLHLAHRELSAADRATKTVTEVATGLGFWELGRFAGAYRDQFGETPLATLSRPPGKLKASKDGPLSF